MEAQAAHTNARVQSEIDAITGQMINVEQQLLAAQNANEDFELLKKELATLQSERKTKRESLVFQPIKKGWPKSDLFTAGEGLRHSLCYDVPNVFGCQNKLYAFLPPEQ